MFEPIEGLGGTVLQVVNSLIRDVQILPFILIRDVQIIPLILGMLKSSRSSSLGMFK